MPKTQRIFLENLNKEEVQKLNEYGIIKIKELIEYNITRKEFIFEFDYFSYLTQLDEILIHIFYPGDFSKNVKGKLEVINPLFQRFVFEFNKNDTIYLRKDI